MTCSSKEEKRNTAQKRKSRLENTNIPTSGSATLIGAWRTGKKVHGRYIRFGGDLQSELQRYAKEAAERITTGTGKDYDPDDEKGEADFLKIQHEELQDTAVVEVLKKATTLQNADSRELKKKKLAFYSLILGDNPERRSIFIKVGNPIKLAEKSLVGIFDNSLTQIKDPVFQFEDNWDIVITEWGVWSFNQKAFERLFKETEVVLARTREWVEKLATLIPIAEEDIEGFAERVRSNSHLRAKVTSLLRKPHIESLDTKVLREKMISRGLDPEVYMPNGTISLKKENQDHVIRLLNEDLFSGDFSGEQYAASKKSVRKY
ncbi:Kiwa anti-phage protein KwaB-like domain-containing protein [Nocardiopsis quinghaiensis]|uniref:Kiwa anti-phage protein KwaB-like domain-containing protein n=1 Tax=Nocardiopsis quinghaiensis TaxID=464995 RepID=UPI00167FFFB6|nr:Kiwa anti-phage protein KwaB-like domain-containing protein [Nocardiopsis quinghaiensis]